MARALGSYPGCRWFKSDCRYHFYGPLVKRLRHRPFTAESWVRFPYGSPQSLAERTNCWILSIDGQNIWSKGVDIRSIRFKVGLVFQYSEYQLFEETVYKDIAYGPKNMGCDEAEVDRRVREAAENMGIREELLERSPFDLSGGQKRRVALAGVIAMDPEILILDEPAAGLDPIGREKVLGKISDYHKKYGKTILLVSHSMEDIVKYADKVLVMNKGKLFCHEDTDSVFARQDEIIKIGLDVPQITKIMMKLRDKGVDLGKDIYTVERAKDRIMQYIDKGTIC